MALLEFGKPKPAEAQQAQAPFSVPAMPPQAFGMQPHPPQQQGFFQHGCSREVIALQSEVKKQVSGVSARMKLVEGHIDTLRSHIDLLDNSLIEKHKAVVQEVRSVEDSVRGLRADIDTVKDLTERIAKRLEELASREQVKILERYVSLWQPLNFVTRSEVETVVKNILTDVGVKIKERE